MAYNADRRGVKLMVWMTEELNGSAHVSGLRC